MLIHELLIMLMMTVVSDSQYIWVGGWMGGCVCVCECDLHILIVQTRNNSMFYTFSLRKSQYELMAPGTYLNVYTSA
jgi:hypothetical protein